MKEQNNSSTPFSFAFLYRILPAELADDFIISFWDEFEKLRAAGCSEKSARLRSGYHGLRSIARYGFYEAVERQRPKFTLANGAALAYAAFIGKGNGSRMSNAEKRSYYAGQAALGALFGLGNFLVFINVNDRYLGGRLPTVDSNGRILLPPHPVTPATLIEYYQVGLIFLAVCALIGICRAAWKRNEFPILGIWYGAGFGALVGLFPSIMLVEAIHDLLHISLNDAAFFRIPLATASIGMAVTLRSRYSAIQREIAFYRRTKVLAEGLLGGALMGGIVLWIAVGIAGSTFTPHILDEKNIPPVVLCILIVSVLIGAALGLRSSIIELQKETKSPRDAVPLGRQKG